MVSRDIESGLYLRLRFRLILQLVEILLGEPHPVELPELEEIFELLLRNRLPVGVGQPELRPLLLREAQDGVRVGWHLPGTGRLPVHPVRDAPLTDSDAAWTLARSLRAFCGSEGVPVSEGDAELDALSPGANGLYSLRERRILLRSALPADQKAKTLAHELAHHLLHRDAGASEGDRPTLEAEAEGTAYAVLSYFGVDASGYSFVYVAHWAERKEVVKVALSNIQKAVREIIEAVEDGIPQGKEVSDHEAA